MISSMPHRFLKNISNFNVLKIASIAIIIVFFSLMPRVAYSAPKMADYCYLPPFVSDPNTPPNIMIAYEKGGSITKRAYSTTYTYDPANLYYGFFDSNAKYYFSVAGNKSFSPNYFVKSSTCNPATDKKCISGNILNWALMTSLDLSRKVVVGFGWPKAITSQGAGDVYTYTGNFCSAWSGTTCTNQNLTPLSYGQYEDGNADTTVAVSVDTDGNGINDYTYRFCMSKGNPETFVTVNGQAGTTPPSCPNPNTAAKCNASATCLGSGLVAVYLGRSCSNNSAIVCSSDSDCPSGGVCTWDDRKGIIQLYADKDSDYVYDSDAPRFGLRRWKTSTASDERDRDILCDNGTGGNCTSTTKTTLLKELLNAFSKEPGIDPDTPQLGNMMADIVNYFSGNSSTYEDKDSTYTQTPYKWATDPARECRKTFTIFVTTGEYLTGTALTLSPDCDTLTYTDSFVKDTCYAFNKDLYTTDGTPPKQNIRTYVVHTTFYGSGSGNEAKLKYASKTVGGGEYIKVTSGNQLKSKLEEAILNILSTSASASTVATLTTQTRESSTLTQAYFYPKRENTPLRWIGYLRLLWSDTNANLREDTLNTAWLDLKKDKILSFFYDTAAVAYKAKTYADDDGDLKPDNCGAGATKRNDNVLTIWNAQDKLLAKNPAEGSRTVLTKTGDTSGKVSGGTLTNFTTALASTFDDFWNYSSYCNGYPSRWCANNPSDGQPDSDCNYCTTLRGTYNVDRGCSGVSDCYYCDGRKTRKCTTTLTCIDTSTGNEIMAACTVAGAPCGGTGICVGDCYEYNGTCTAGSLVCNDDFATSCFTLGVQDVCNAGAICVRNCSLNPSVYCSGDPACIGDYRGSEAGTGDGCITTDTCTAAADGTCLMECDTNNCAYSVIKYIRGYDNPTNSSGGTTPGSSYRIRSQCATNADCPGGTCTDKVCRSTSISCSMDSDCTAANPGDICVGTCSGVSTDVIKTLKLGDIVYSTPRISPNSAVNGYDIVYGDSSYGNFINSKIKGNCTTNADCPGTSDRTWSSVQTCSNGVCSEDGYTPMVIVGANDGMVHAFKVAKIKDISPPSKTNESDITTPAGSDDGSYQIARFADKPRSSSDTAPPSDLGEELWAYVPFNSIPYLRWYCDETYCHIPMVDARFTIIDASIDYDKDGNIEPESGAGSESKAATDPRCDTTNPCPNYPWRRLLIGAMGVGGNQITVGNNTWSSSIFVLDITNPLSPVLLWERPLPDRTLTTATPAVIRLADSSASVDTTLQNGKWYLLIGSGAQSISTNKLTYKTGTAKIFVFDLRTGENMTKGADNIDMTSDDGISIGASNVAVGDMMAVDMDSDYQVDDIYFGTYGSNTGNLYRLRVRNDGASSTPVYQTNPADWDIETVVNVGRPIFAAPEIAVDSAGNKWLYFGTGLYLTLEHAKPMATCSNDATRACIENTDCPSGGTCNAVGGYTEYLYGVKEKEVCWKGKSGCSTYNNFLDTTNITLTNAKALEVGCFCAGTLISSLSCDADGNCTGSCGTNKICDNNTTQTCANSSECPSGGTCIENKVVLKVRAATLSGYSGTGTSCDGQMDTAAISCLEERINIDGCSNGPCDGWKRQTKGQKIFSRPFVGGGLVDYTSFQPTATSCSLGGNTHLISLHYTTGTPYIQPTILMAGGTSGATNNLTIKASVNLGVGVPPLGESLVALPLAGDTYKVITQVSGGLPGTTLSPSSLARSGYVLWLVK